MKSSSPRTGYSRAIGASRPRRCPWPTRPRLRPGLASAYTSDITVNGGQGPVDTVTAYELVDSIARL